MSNSPEPGSIEAESARVQFPQIEGLEIISVLSSGNTATVYKGKQLLLDRFVAVKVLSFQSSFSRDALLRFQQEVKITAALDHPNIARTLGSGISSSGQPYLLIEYLEGETLSSYLSKNRALSFRKVGEIFLPLLSALAFAHERGLLHRDIKPQNIFLSRQDSVETVKLLDFGIAVLFDEEGQRIEQKLTKAGTALGTPAYMSPEQCLAQKVDLRSDLYSLACVLYEALTGLKPFEGESALEIMHKHTSGILPSTLELTKQKDLPEEVSRLLLRALDKDPSKRPQTAQEFSAAFQSAMDKLTLDRVPSAPLSEKRRPVPILLFLFLSGIFALFFFVFQQVPEKSKRIRAELSDYEQNESAASLALKAGKLESTARSAEAFPYRERELAKLKSGNDQYLAEASLATANDAWALAENFKYSDPQKCKYYLQKVCDYTSKALKIGRDRKLWQNFSMAAQLHMKALLNLGESQKAIEFYRQARLSMKKASLSEQLSLSIGASENFQGCGKFALAEEALQEVEKQTTNAVTPNAMGQHISAASGLSYLLYLQKRQLEAEEKARAVAKELRAGVDLVPAVRMVVIGHLKIIFQESDPVFLKRILEAEQADISYVGYSYDQARLLQALAEVYEKLGENEKSLQTYKELYDFVIRELKDGQTSSRILQAEELTRLSSRNKHESNSLQRMFNDDFRKGIELKIDELSKKLGKGKNLKSAGKS